MADLVLGGLKDLFIPSDDFFKEKFAVVTAKFGWLGDIVEAAECLIDCLKNPYGNSGSSGGHFGASSTALLNSGDVTFAAPSADAAPTLTIKLDDVNSGFYYGDTWSISFAWFEPYRDMFHDYLQVFLWVAFLWNTFKSLPSIINGASTGINVGASVSSASSSEE